MPRFTVLFVALCFALSTSVALAATPDGEIQSTYPLEVAMTLRADSGFDSGKVTVEALLADRETDFTYGLPLTKSEASEMARREVVRDNAEGLIRYILDRPGEFGGIYYDYSDGFALVVQVTASTEAEDLASVKALWPVGVDVRLDEVAFTFEELRAAQARIRITAADGQLDFEFTYPDVRRNRLVVGAATEHDLDALKAIDVAVPVEYLLDTFSPTACSSRLACTPHRGGTKIVNSDGLTCTSAFNAKASTTRYLLTAGHCSQLSKTYKHNGVTFTSGVTRNTHDFATGTTVYSDSLRAPLTSNSGNVAPFNTIYVTSGDPARTITSTDTTQIVGDPVCLSAWFYSSSVFTCGNVYALGADLNIERGTTSRIFHDQIVTNIVHPSGGLGESGSPFFYGHAAIGLATGLGPGSRIAYSPIWRVTGEMGVSLCLTSAC